MKNKQYEDDVREFVANQNGVFLVVSNDSLFNRNIGTILLRQIEIDASRIVSTDSVEIVHKQVKQLLAGGHTVLLFVEREINGHDNTDIVQYLKADYNSQLYIILLTTEVERDRLIRLHEIGADNIITKPILPSTLVEKIAFTVKPRGHIGELMDQGRYLLDAGDFLGAAKMARQVLELKPSSPSGLLLMGDALLAMDKTDEALRAYHQAEKGAKLFLEPLKKIAALHRASGNTAQELRFLERLDKLSPLNVNRKVEIGTGYIKLGEQDKAKTAFDQAVKLATKEAIDAVSRVTQAIAVNCLEFAPDLSEQYLRQTLATRKNMLDRSDIDTFNRLGLTLRRQGKWEEAVAEYRKAMRIAPDDAGLFYNIAMAYAEGRQHIEAYQFLDRALTINPELWRTSEAVCYNIATVYQRYGKNDLAAEYLKRALSLNPGFDKAQSRLNEVNKGR